MEKAIDQEAANIIQISSLQGDVVRISPYAAHVLSWKTSYGIEQLFLSPKAEFRDGAAIRGGVPVIFPQFAGLGPLSKHGFARTQYWQVVDLQPGEVTLSLSDNQQTLAAWPHQFKLDYHIQISDGELSLELSLLNCGSAPFSFTSALHTYFSVEDSTRAFVTGLKGLQYRDSANGDKLELDAFENVNFTAEVDRIYQDVHETITLHDGSRKLLISSALRSNSQQPGFRDAVIWNPGTEKCARLGDMLPDGFLKFVCIESASAAKPVILSPSETWNAAQNIKVITN